MKPLRILILADPYSRPSFAPRLRYLCDYLCRQGHQIEVFTEQWDTIPFDHPYPIHEIPLMRGGLWALKSVMNLLFDWKSRVFTRRVQEAVQGKRFDLIFCTTFSTFPLASAARIARQSGLPWIADIRDLDEQVPGAQYQYHRQWWTRPFRRLYRAVQIRRRNQALQSAKTVTTVSPWHVDFLQKKHADVRLIYNGFAPQRFYWEAQPANEFLVSYIGRLYEFQSLDLIQACIRELNLPHLRLNLHTPDHAPLSIEQVGDEIRRSSVILVLTNRNTHGMMTTKFFEALGCEKPVLCIPDDQGLLSATIRQHNAGLASDDKETIKAFLQTQYQTWQQQGYTHQAVHHKELFNRENQAQQFEDLFRHSTRL